MGTVITKLVAAGLLDEREGRLARNCLNYAGQDPAGLPGHNILLIIPKLLNALAWVNPQELDHALAERPIYGDITTEDPCQTE